MASVPQSLRFLLINNIFKRNIKMSASLRAKEALEELKNKNPYYDKYAAKIAALQKTSPEEFLERAANVSNPVEKLRKEQSRTYSELLNPKKPLAKATSEIPNKKLEDIMKLELVQDKTAEEVAQIWLEYHKNKDVLAATLTRTQFETLVERGKKHPLFILPLPRSEGFEFIMLQFAANSIHFTPLLAYQVHAENAPECLNMVHYIEMIEKDIVLMRGEYDNKVLTAQEAQCLANQMQMFYYMADDSKLKLLETFTKNPNDFKHMDLIKEIENIQLA